MMINPFAPIVGADNIFTEGIASNWLFYNLFFVVLFEIFTCISDHHNLRILTKGVVLCILKQKDINSSKIILTINYFGDKIDLGRKVLKSIKI